MNACQTMPNILRNYWLYVSSLSKEFIHLFIHSFIHSYIHSIIYSFIHSFFSFLSSFLSFSLSFIHSFIGHVPRIGNCPYHVAINENDKENSKLQTMQLSSGQYGGGLGGRRWQGCGRATAWVIHCGREWGRGGRGLFTPHCTSVTVSGCWPAPALHTCPLPAGYRKSPGMSSNGRHLTSPALQSTGAFNQDLHQPKWNWY